MKIQWEIALVAALGITGNPSAAMADLDCAISNADSQDIKGELLLRAGTTKREAVLITDWGVRTYTCEKAIVDAYECYGFTAKPGETPSQLNIVGKSVEAGTIILETTLNIFFLHQFVDVDRLEPIDFETRRVATNVYVIQDCK